MEIVPGSSEDRRSMIQRYSHLYACLVWLLLVSYSQHISWNPLLVLLSPLVLIPPGFLWSIEQGLTLPVVILVSVVVLEGVVLLAILLRAWCSRNIRAQCWLWTVTFSFGLILAWADRIRREGSWTKGLVGSWRPGFPVWVTLLLLGLCVLALASSSFYLLRTRQIRRTGFVTYLVSCLIVCGIIWHLRNPRIEFLDYFYEGLAKARIFGLWAYVDYSRRVVIPPSYDFAKPFSDGLASVHIWSIAGDPLGCYIDRTGRVVLKMPEGGGGSFHEGLASFSVNSKQGFIDKTGTVVIPPKFDGVDRFFDGLAAIEVNSKYGFIDKFGGVVIAPRFDQVGRFSEGLARALVTGKWGYIGRDGKLAIPGPFKHAGDFTEGLAVVGVEDKSEMGSTEKFGYIDRLGHFVIPAQFDHADNFSGGVAEILQDGRQILIDKDGKPVN